MQTSTLPSSLPPQLLQVLNELDVVPRESAGDLGEDFWLRLATQLEQLEEVAAALPEDADVDDLAAWLAVGLGGEELPEDGKDLPLPPGLLLSEPARSALSGSDGSAPQYAGALAGAPGGPVAAEMVATHLREGGEDGRLRARAGEPAPETRHGAALPLIDAEAPNAARLAPAFGAGLQDAINRNWGGASALPAGAAAELASLHARAAENATLSSGAPFTATPVTEPASGLRAGAGSAAAPRMFHLDAPLQQNGWDREFGNGIRWMVNQNVQLAEMRLNPPHLGPLEVRLQVEGDRTHVNIVAPHATTREAVEAALPRLREMFAESGLNLGDVNVRQDSAGRDGSETAERLAADQAASTDGEGLGATGQNASATAHAGRGLVDFYA